MAADTDTTVASMPLQEDEPLIPRKLAIPAVPGNMVLRPRLVELLAGPDTARITAVFAPAGWGKTLLLCSWLHQPANASRVGWVSLDRQDNDPVRFFRYLLAAIREIDDLADHPVSSLAPPHSSGAELDVFLAVLASTMYDLPVPIVLVLDDVHELTDATTLRGLAFLLVHAPPSVRLVLAGRYVPPDIPASRLRLAGALTEVSVTELAFTTEEAGELFTMSGLALTPDQVVRLHSRTEGWPAGVRLAALSLTTSRDVDRFVTDFSGDERAVSEYLMSEVFASQTQDEREFLLRTSVCSRLNASLASTLTGRGDGGLFLERMAARNSFVMSLPGKGNWFRYHQLFADFLRQRLAQSDQPAVERLHGIAAEWLIQHGELLDAFNHAVAAEAWVDAGCLLRETWLGLFLDGELNTLKAMLSPVPTVVLEAVPEFAYVQAAVALAADDVDAARHNMDLARRAIISLAEPRRAKLQTTIALVEMESARLNGDVDQATAASAALLTTSSSHGSEAVVTQDVADVRALALLQLGTSEYWADRRVASERHLTHALQLARKTDRDYIAVGALSMLTSVNTTKNKLSEGVRLAETAVGIANGKGWAQMACTGEAWAGLAWVSYMRNRLDDADRYLDAAEDATRAGEVTAFSTVRLMQGLVLAAHGKHAEAVDILWTSWHLAQGVTGPYIFESYIHGGLIRSLLLSGRTAEAWDYLRDLAAPMRSEAYVLLAEADLLVARGEPASALSVLGMALTREGRGLFDQRLAARVASAVLRHELGDERGAFDELEMALGLAEPEGLVQPFLRSGWSGRCLLARHAGRSGRVTKHPGFVSELLAGFAPRVPAEGQLKTQEPRELQGEPLTAREIDVLRYLGTVLTIPEIAAELYVSQNTVKGHLKSIYRKLGVTSRRQAVLTSAYILDIDRPAG